MLDEHNTPVQVNQNHGQRYLMLGLFIVLIAALVYFGSIIRKQEPDFYAPGRTAIINARMHFEESLGYEQALYQQQQLAHDEINLAISQLADAAALDPADRSKIESMRAQLLAIEKADLLRGNTPNKLQQQYHDLLEQMDKLRIKMENHAQ